MAAIISRKFSQKLHSTAWRAFSSEAGKPYWAAKFPDGPKSFEEIPVIEEKNYDVRKVNQIFMQFFKKYGYVAKEWRADDTYCVHLFHFDDFRTVYYSDGLYPTRKSHRVMRHYREARKDMYDNVGLGAGEGPEWWDLRSIMAGGVTERIIRPLQPNLEEVANDLVKMLHIKAKEGDVELLPWLFRWAFESAGLITLNRRMGALSESGNEIADKMVEAAGITNEMIALSETDWKNYDKHYSAMVPAQDFTYSVISQYCDEIACDPNAKCMVKTMMKQDENAKKNAVTLTMDIFQGALQTVPLTVLMACYNLARNKHVQDGARKELLNLLPQRDSSYFSTVKKFTDDIPKYLSGIVWETLRLSPPIIGNGRVLQQDLVLGGYMVPKGTNSILHQQVACLQEENFEEPSKFIPERHPTPCHQHLEYIFGGRRRICFGKNFALGQMCLVVAKILRNFDICYDGEDISIINRLHNEPENPLFMKLTPLE